MASIQKRTIPIKFAHLAEKSGKGSISNLSTKAGIAVLGMLLSQTLIMLTATYYINEYAGSSDPEIRRILEDSREEHKAVEKMRRETAAFDASYRAVTNWSVMTTVQRCLLLISTAGTLGTAIAVSANSDMFFRKFAASSRVGAPYENTPPGLDGKPFSLVRVPLGWIVLAIHYFAFFFFFFWSKNVTRSAEAHLKNEQTREIGTLEANVDDGKVVAEVVGAEHPSLLIPDPQQEQALGVTATGDETASRRSSMIEL